ncbi:myosin-13 [Mastacembelus armatus]|uniref:myosin-13 n=1 Tax=Mastacembelus armatus TaxID=205130 RepID=UPI000E4617EF|nr:myosin-13-like [Mastacembelus armatus]
MASCLVPDFPAVMIALEHLKELDKQVKEEGVAFAPEACLHLAEITVAVTDLEANRRAAHEHLEVETIENSKLRYQINDLRERMSQEIMADVAAARASNTEEIEQLQKDLSTVSQLKEATLKKQDALLSQNEALYPDREQVQTEHEEIIAVLNEKITLKYDVQMKLDQTREKIEGLKSCIAAVEQAKLSLQQNMALERDAFTVKKDNLSRELVETDERIKQQKVVITRSKRTLDSVNDKKLETLGRLRELMMEMSKLERSTQGLTASRCQFEKQLQGETQKHQELQQQRQTLKKELCDLKEAFSLDIQRLKDEIATVEGKIEAGRASGLLCQDRMAQIYEVFKHQYDEENEMRAEHFEVSQQLQRSKRQLEDRIASIVKNSTEIKEMDRQITELLEANVINNRVFERNQKELCGNMDIEMKKLSYLEEENSCLGRLLEEAKREQEAYVAKMNSDISKTRRRYQELQCEEMVLQQRWPKTSDADLVLSHITQSEVEYKQIESRHHQEIEQYNAETECITRSKEEKQKEVEQKEEMLKEIEAKWSEEQSRHQRLKMLTSELRSRKTELELSIEELKVKTRTLLQPKEEKKTELESLRASYIDMLNKQTSEIRAVEISFYNNSMKLEQVSMENSRLHLCIRQMTEDVSRARQNKDKYWQEFHRFTEDTKALVESLQEAWREDLLVTQYCQSSDNVVLLSLKALLDHLKNRKQHLGNINTLLHQQMLEFSKRLGDRTTIDQHS